MVGGQYLDGLGPAFPPLKCSIQKHLSLSVQKPSREKPPVAMPSDELYNQDQHLNKNI